MKKTLAILLALAMVFSTLTVAFAEGTIGADAQACATLGMLKGDTSAGVTADYVAQAPTRLTAAILFLRLKGLENEALAYTGTDNFADVNEVNWAGGKAILGYLKTHPELGWVGDQGKFAPNDKITAQQYYKVMLETLGYKQSTTSVVGDFTFDKTVEFAATKSLTKVATVTSFTVNDVAIATIEALKANLKEGGKTLAQSLVDAKVITADAAKSAGVMPADVALAVDSVNANTAKSFEVKFNKAVDTSKVTFAVTRGTVAVTTTTTWNSDNTVATLTAAAKLPEATYNVVVKNDNVELAKKEAVIGKEVVKTIEYKSNQVLRKNNTEGVVGFKVLNQYGEDVTNLALGRSLTFMTSTSDPTPDVDYKAGVLTITHSYSTLNELKDIQTVVVTARDTTTGFVQTNTLTVSNSVGVLADIKLLGVVDENGKSVDFKYDLAKTYYLDYEATDVLGNKMYNYDALTAQLYNQDILSVKSSNETYVVVKAEKNPKDSTKLAFRLELGVTAPSYDTPITFLAIAPFAAKSSNLTATLYRKTAVETFRMQNPAETASVDKAIEIPFEAFDQAGNPVTMYDDLISKIDFGTAPVTLVRQGDGTAKLFATFSAKQTYYITSTVRGSLTGSFSQIAIDVKDLAIPTTIDPLAHAKAYVQNGKWTSIRVSSFTVRDQFDRAMKLRDDYLASAYSIRITTSNPAIINVSGGTTKTIAGETTAYFQGGITPGTATITYELLGPTGAKVDSATAIAYNVPKSDVKSVKLTLSSDTTYMLRSDARYQANTTPFAVTNMGNDNNYEIAPTFVGMTDSGMEVRLDSNDRWYTSTDDRFTMINPATGTGWTNSGVLATGDFGDLKTASAVLTGYYNGTNGVLTATATMNAKSDAPIIDSVEVDYDHNAQRTGIISVNNDVVDVTAANFTTNFGGKSLFYYDVTGAYADGGDYSPLSFYAMSQYGAAPTDRVVVTDKAGNTGDISVDNSTGVVTITTPVAHGDEFTISVLAVNGKSKVVRIRIQ